MAIQEMPGWVRLIAGLLPAIYVAGLLAWWARRKDLDAVGAWQMVVILLGLVAAFAAWWWFDFAPRTAG
jgi:hypothetical protein